MNSIKRIFDIPEFQSKNFPLDVALAAKENNKWKTYSTKEYLNNANLISKGLLKLGIKPGEKIAMISNNRPEWNIMDIGILQIGAIDVPVYPTITEKDYKFIFNDAEVKLCIVSDEDLLNKVKNIIDDIPSLTDIYTFNEISGAKHWSEIMKLGENEENSQVDELKQSITEDDLATLIYTSGTTGTPKGVMLSHKNLVQNAIGSKPRLPITSNEVGLSFLPVCHVYERMILYLYQLTGVSIYFAESLETIKENIVDIRPHVFTAVPRLLEKVYDGIINKGAAAGGLKAKIFSWAVGLTESYEYGKHPSIQRKIADKLVYSKIREGLGGRIKAIASGSAALQPRLARFFHAIGLPVYEGYGLTETSPVVSVNAASSGVVFGSVGKKLDNVEVKIAEDGEILTKGVCLMMGYYKREDITKEVIDSDGWFHTGDIGILDSNGFLKITDRKKEIFKTSGGKYVAPQLMENKFKESRFIEQIMVIGENQKHPAALLVPAFDFVKNWCESNNINVLDNKSLCEHDEVISKIKSEVDFYNTHFSQWEQVKKIELIDQEFAVETGELTPTLKFKRKIILDKYKNLVAKIYN